MLARLLVSLGLVKLSRHGAAAGVICGWLLTVVLLINVWNVGRYIADESEIGISLHQLASADGERKLYAGDEISLRFDCHAAQALRYMVRLTATGNPKNVGTLSLAIDGLGKKVVRTGLFNKISGTYSFPFYGAGDANSPEEKTLRISIAGGEPGNPVLYLAKRRGKEGSLQVEMSPEGSHAVKMPRYSVFPRSVKEYVPSGECSLRTGERS